MATQPGWLHQLPLFRMPKRHHHHHHGHHHQSLPVTIGRGILGLLLVELWCLEFTIWFGVWCYYGLFLGCRWIYRNNVIGKAATVASTPVRKAAPAYDPHGAPPQPIDLGQLGDGGDPWDTGGMRRRS